LNFASLSKTALL